MKILIISTGGTICCKKTKNGLSPKNSGKTIARLIPESLKDKCEIKELFSCDSCDMDNDVVLEIAKTIEENYNDFDGFVVTHGTDTLCYTAATLSYLIQNSPKPIVITGSMLPPDAENSDAKSNLINSICLALNEDAHNVSVCFDGKIFCATHVKKADTVAKNAIKNANFPPLAGIKDNYVGWYIFCDYDGSEEVKFYHKLEPSVISIKILPNMKFEDIEDFISKYKGIIIEGFGMGGLSGNKGFAEGLEKLRQQGHIVILATQVFSGICDYSAYASGTQLKNIKYYKNMTVESLLAKLSWSIANSENEGQVYKLMDKIINYDNKDMGV